MSEPSSTVAAVEGTTQSSYVFSDWMFQAKPIPSNPLFTYLLYILRILLIGGFFYFIMELIMFCASSYYNGSNNTFNPMYVVIPVTMILLGVIFFLGNYNKINYFMSVGFLLVLTIIFIIIFNAENVNVTTGGTATPINYTPFADPVLFQRYLFACLTLWIAMMLSILCCTVKQQTVPICIIILGVVALLVVLAFTHFQNQLSTALPKP